MDLKKIKHDWEVDKIIREANIQHFTETGEWRRGPEPRFEILETTIEALLNAAINLDNLAAENNKLATELVEKITNALEK